MIAQLGEGWGHHFGVTAGWSRSVTLAALLACCELRLPHCPHGATQCPHPTGTALRHCDEHKGWLPPNLFNCSALAFAALRPWVSRGDTSESHGTVPLGPS